MLSGPQASGSRWHSVRIQLRRALRRHRRLAAAGLAAMAAAVALDTLAPAPPATVAVVVTAQDLPAGTTLTSNDLRVVQVLTSTRPAGASEDLAGLVGQVLAGAARQGEPLTDVRLVGSGLLSGQPEGTVAAPVRLSDPATAALLAPGDTVDVLAGPSPDAAFVAGSGDTAGQQADLGAQAVARGALVLAVPSTGAGGSLLGGVEDAGGLVLLAVDADTALRLAGVAGHRWVGVALVP